VKRDETIRDQRKLHNGELHNLYTSTNIIITIKSRRVRWVGHIACMGAKRNEYMAFVNKTEGKKPLQRPRHRSDDNIKMDLREI
jgi:hypothetical protein